MYCKEDGKNILLRILIISFTISIKKCIIITDYVLMRGVHSL